MGVEVTIEMTKRLEKSFERIRKGGGIILIHHTSEGGCNFQLQNGRGVSPNVISKLKAAGRLKPGGDGLFGDDEQTLHAILP